MTLTKKSKRIVLVCVAVLLTALLILGIYGGAVLYIRKIGISLSPGKDYPVREITYYLQGDPEWGSDGIGDSSTSMAAAGCLISCVASSMTEMGLETTPDELNGALTGVDGFEGDILLWYKLNEAYPEIDYSHSRIFSSGTIQRDLEAGKLPIVKVYYKGGGVQHWLLVLGAENGEFMVMDPMNAELEPIPLSTHGKVYAYRVLEYAD